MALDERGATEKTVGAVLVIGGGIGGMQAALDLADSGFYVYMTEKKPAIGGVMAQLDKTFPTNDCSMCIMAPKLVECGRHLNIEVITNSEVADVQGTLGNFTVRLVKHARYVDQEKCTGCGVCAMHCPVGAARDEFNSGLGTRPSIYIEYPQAVPLAYVIDRDTCIGCGLCETLCLAQAVKYDDATCERELKVGAIIVATGFDAYDPSERKEYGYGRFPNVVTSMEFERILSASGPYEGRVLRPSDGDIPRRIAFIQCVGSRDRAAGNGYCSSVCCMYATKEAVIAKEHAPGVEATVFFMDMRSYGKGFEAYIERAKEEYGVRFRRTRVGEVREEPDTGNQL
jgi:heterodisulfide reductase subunit A